MSEPDPNAKRCQDFLFHLSPYIDQDVSAQVCEEIERHLAACADCDVVVDSLKRTVSLYHTLPQPEMPERLRERLYRTFHLEELLSRVRIASVDEDKSCNDE